MVFTGSAHVECIFSLLLSQQYIYTESKAELLQSIYLHKITTDSEVFTDTEVNTCP
jgi:hypothetical protein